MRFIPCQALKKGRKIASKNPRSPHGSRYLGGKQRFIYTHISWHPQKARPHSGHGRIRSFWLYNGSARGSVGVEAFRDFSKRSNTRSLSRSSVWWVQRPIVAGINHPLIRNTGGTLQLSYVLPCIVVYWKYLCCGSWGYPDLQDMHLSTANSIFMQLNPRNPQSTEQLAKLQLLPEISTSVL